MLKKFIDKLAINEGLNPTGISGVEVFRISTPFSRINTVLPASVCIIAQGRKNLYLGDKKYIYDEKTYLIGSIKVPVEAELMDTSVEKPCLGVIVDLDATIIGELLTNFDDLKEWQIDKKTEEIITTTPLNKAIDNTLQRILQSAYDPMDIKVLSRSLIREFFYEILKTPQGHILRNSVQHHTKVHQMVPTIKYLEKNFKNETTIDELARFASMSVPSLHKHFKKATSLSPIQFIKQLRLHHAYKLLLEGKNASLAALDSGYTNAAQFSREFKRFFGVSPRDIMAR